MNTFRNLSEEEYEFIKRTIKEDQAMETLQICFVSDKRGKFTTCLLKVKNPPLLDLYCNEIYVGNSKRVTYAKMADTYNEATGRLVSLGRAIKHLVNKESFVSL